MLSSQQIKDLLEKAAPGPWEGCNHVKKHEFDSECKCGAACVWSRPVDTIICDKYRNDDGSGPEPVNREMELATMSLIVHTPDLAAQCLELMEEVQRLLEARGLDPRNHIHEAGLVNIDTCRKCGHDLRKHAK